MFPTTPDSPNCAAPYSARIELVPSWRAAALLFGWLLAVSVAILCGTTLLLPARIALGALLFGLGVPGIRRCCLLRSSCAVHAIAWTGDGRWHAWLGPQRVRREVRIARGSFRLGDRVFLLWLKSCDGLHVVFIDVEKHDESAVRRLARRLNRAPERGASEGPWPS